MNTDVMGNISDAAFRTAIFPVQEGREHNLEMCLVALRSHFPGHEFIQMHGNGTLFVKVSGDRIQNIQIILKTLSPHR